MKHQRAIIISCICITILCLFARYAYNKRNDIKQFVHERKLEYYSNKETDIDYLKSLDLPLVLIQTEDSNEPTFEESESPTGWGRGIKNAAYVKMDIDIFLHDSLSYSNRNEGGGKNKN